MFALFFSLYYAMFTGTWQNFALQDVVYATRSGLNSIGTLLTSIFNNVDTPMTTLGNLVEPNSFGYNQLLSLVCLILALITSIGIVVMAVKGVKKAFGIFFMGIRR